MMKRKKLFISIMAIFFAVILTFATFGSCSLLPEKVRNFEIMDTLPDGQNKKATVILLGGQSNASGCSLDRYLQKNVSAEKYSEYANGYDNVYINYHVSGVKDSFGFVKCKTGQGELDGELGAYFGPELGLAEKLHELYPDELFFIIKYAWGGTDLFSQWLPPSSSGETGKLYKEFVKFADTSLKYLTSKNYDVKIEGMCWMQGESDSFSVEHATDYKVNLSNLIKDIRKKFSSYAADDGIAFIDALIANNPVFWVYCDIVNTQKLEVAKESPLNVVIDTSMLVCTEEPEGNPDIPHYDSLSQIKLGHLFAEEIVKFF